MNAQKLVSLLLSKLKEVTEFSQPEKPGVWNFKSSEYLQDLAKSIDVGPLPREQTSVSSVPDMWARPLVFEMALHIKEHPLSKQFIEQWRGMLAVIALSEEKDFDLRVHPVDLRKLERESDFTHSLYSLLPLSTNALFTFEEQSPWEKLFIFLWNGHPVGITSPSTLVCPSEYGNWGDLPWSEKNELISPEKYLSCSECIQLYYWIENLCHEINYLHNDYYAGDSAKNTILYHLHSFQESLKEKIGSSNLLPSITKEYLTANLSNQSLHHDDTEPLSPFNCIFRPVKKDFTNLESEKFLIDKLFFFDQKNALPGSFSPSGADSLTYEGKKITPLLPVKDEIFNHIQPQDMIEGNICRFETVQKGNKFYIRFSINIDDLPSSKYPDLKIKNLTKDYFLEERNIISELPVLEVWPKFVAEDWDEYYVFYYDRTYKKETFRVDFSNKKSVHEFEDNNGFYNIWRLSNFPTKIKCLDFRHNLQGFILTNTPKALRTLNPVTWTVGIDFGTSFTNIFTKDSGSPISLKLESLHLQITGGDQATRLRSLFERFIPDPFIPEEKPLPIASALTTRTPSKELKRSEAQPILDGRIYIPQDSHNFNPNKEWIKTNLKWSEYEDSTLFRILFLKHLSLHILALARKKGVGKIIWSIGFPSAFSYTDTVDYIGVWEKVIESVDKITRIKNDIKFPKKREEIQEIRSLDSFHPESIAAARFFAGHEGHDLINSVCIDIGGGTSDISIWKSHKLLHQCSLRFAGKDLFTNLLRRNKEFVKSQLKLELENSPSSNIFNLDNDSDYTSKIDVWLRQEGEEWLLNERDITSDSEEVFREMLRISALGFSGIYYYVGYILKYLCNNSENEYTDKFSTISIFLGGNGSRFLHWLSRGGRFNSSNDIDLLLSKMLNLGANFSNSLHVKSIISLNPKDEVACGLVMNNTGLSGLGEQDRNQLVAGESYKKNGELFGANTYIYSNQKEAIREFEVSNKLSELRRFFNLFNKLTRTLELDEIKPFWPDNISELEQSLFWNSVSRELENLCHNMTSNSNQREAIRMEPPFIIALKAMMKVLINKNYR